MKVHITYTEEYSQSKIDMIVKILNKSFKTITFINSSPLTDVILQSVDVRFSFPNLIFSLNFSDLFNICNLQRRNINQANPGEISEDDYVVLITSKRNSKNWFSAVEDRNIFIHSESFTQNTDRDEEYGIAHNILVNIFQSLLGVNWNTLPENSISHDPSIGCINDHCRQKSDILLKLRTGYICDSCLELAINNNVSLQRLIDFHTSLQLIREEFMNLNLIKSNSTFDNVVVDANGEIYVGSIKLELSALEKTLYYFYLTHLNGFETRFFNDENTANKLFAIYRVFYDGADVEKIKRLCRYPGDNNSTYSRRKSEMHQKIKNKLGDILSKFYSVVDDSIIAENQRNARICRIKNDQFNIVIDPTFSNRIADSEEFVLTRYPYQITNAMLEIN